jgi:hypothetical protein
MQLPDVSSDQPLTDELIRLLAARGPLTYEQVSEAFGEDPDDADWDDTFSETVVDEVDRIVELSDERLADAVTLLAGCTLTRRITDEEAAGGYLELGGDLQPFVTVTDGSVPLARRGRASIQLGDSPGRATTERLVGPPAWLDDASAGDLVGLHLADGLLSVAARPTVGDAGPAADAFATAARARFDETDQPRTGLVDVVWDAMSSAPAAFSGVLPPLSDIAAAAGLQLTETTVLPAEADLDELPATIDAVRNAIAVVHLRADAKTLASLAHLRTVTRRLEVGAEVAADDLDRAGVVLADPQVFDAYVRESADGEGGALLGAAVAPQTEGTSCAAACYLQARHALRRDDISATDSWLRDALEADPDFAPALIDAARIAEIRGGAAIALQHLQRAGVRDDQWVQRLRRYATGVKAGRNEPCPCGSGRKTKRCCGGGGSSRPLPGRTAWLLEKLYAAHDHTIEQRLSERLEAAAHVSDWAVAGSRHVVVEDVVLFDLGLLDDFLRRWAAHLPEDERELAETWRSTRRGLYDVRRVHGATVTLIDRRDGTERVARHASSPPPRETTILARLLPDGGGAWLLTAGVTVGDEHHPAIECSIDPDADPLEVAAIWGSNRPLLSTTEGEPSVQCTWEAPLAAERHDQLRAALLRQGLKEDEPAVFTDTVEVDRDTRLRGTITVDSGLVRVTTNSEPRLERLIGYIRDTVGNLEPSVDRRVPTWRAVADQRLYGVPSVPAEPTAEERAMLDEMLQLQEKRWLDESVPALSNLTPREARDHPTARRALLELLDSFEAAPAGGFNPERLRSLLDL